MDIFESHNISLVLSWLFCSFIFVGLFGYLVETFFEKGGEMPRIVTIWFSLCLIILSPFRYLLLQITIGTAYPFQSLSAFISTLILSMYIPIVFGLLYAICFALPLLGVLYTGLREPVTRAKMFLACLLAPVGCLLGSYMFTLILPYAATSIRWLKVKDVIRATNGPAYYFHEYVVDIWNPMDLFVDEDRRHQSLREHIVVVYFGDQQKASFRRAVTVQHFRQSLAYSNEATATLENAMPDDHTLLVSIDAEIIDKVLSLQKLALSEARLVPIEELNNRFARFGDHFRDEFIPGLEKMINSYEQGERFGSFQGRLLMNNFGDWYVENRENIVTRKKK